MDCPACGKSHNRPEKAASCRELKARELTRRGRVAAPNGAPLFIPWPKTVTSSACRKSASSVPAMKRYCEQQSRDNAIGGSI